MRGNGKPPFPPPPFTPSPFRCCLYNIFCGKLRGKTGGNCGKRALFGAFRCRGGGRFGYGSPFVRGTRWLDCRRGAASFQRLTYPLYRIPPTEKYVITPTPPPVETGFGVGNLRYFCRRCRWRPAQPLQISADFVRHGATLPHRCTSQGWRPCPVHGREQTGPYKTREGGACPARVWV